MKRACCILLGAMLLAPAAQADTPPTAWDRAKDPNAAPVFALHTAVRRSLRQAKEERAIRRYMPNTDAGHLTLQNVVDQLERYGAEKSADVRLRFDLGEAYVAIAPFEVDRPARYRKAMAVTRSALAMAPDHPMAEEGWWTLALACGNVGETTCEKEAYVEHLKHRTEPEGRATPVLNLAETEMHLGNLREAIEGYREALRLSGLLQGDPLTAPLAMWGLAVALDRSGDHLGAEREARSAVELEISSGWRRQPGVTALRSDGVFFYPSYEVHWYEGLEFTALARTAKTARESFRLFEKAETSFARYVAGAERDKDRWLDVAKARLAATRVDREKAEKRAASEPRPAAPPPRAPEEPITF